MKRCPSDQESSTLRRKDQCTGNARSSRVRGSSLDKRRDSRERSIEQRAIQKSREVRVPTRWRKLSDYAPFTEVGRGNRIPSWLRLNREELGGEREREKERISSSPSQNSSLSPFEQKGSREGDENLVESLRSRSRHIEPGKNEIAAARSIAQRLCRGLKEENASPQRTQGPASEGILLR